jgi:hypothetical protein
LPDRRRCLEPQSAQSGFFLEDAPLNKSSFKFCEACLEQRSISGNVLAASAQLGESFINHSGAPEKEEINSRIETKRLRPVEQGI